MTKVKIKPYPIPEDEPESIDDITLLEPTAIYSYADYLRWTFEERVELIKGKLFEMSPAPVRVHQEISINMLSQLIKYIKGKPCRVYHAPFDVRLAAGRGSKDEQVYSVVQPDICIICDLSILDEKGCNGSPSMVAEILSPSTAKKDLTDKLSLYEENNIPEYWIIFPNDQILEVYLLRNDGKYGAPTRYTKNDQVPVTVLGNALVDAGALFRD